MKKRLDMSLVRIGSVLVGQIFSMDEKLRHATCDGVSSTIADEHTGYYIRSCSHPSISDFSLYVRGAYSSHDNDTFCYNYENVRDAIKAAKAFKALIDKINSVETAESRLDIETIV